MIINSGVPKPPPLPPPPVFKGFGFTGHHVKNGFDKDKLRMFLRKGKIQDQESEQVFIPKKQYERFYQDQKLLHLHKITRPDQDQNGHTRSEPGTIEGGGTTQHDWVISVRIKLEQANRDDDRTSRGTLCIYKVPNYLHGKENNSYFPQTVALGPYHHGKEQTQSMECHKWRAVNKVLKRTKQDFKVFIDAMKKLEERARACYEGPISLNSYKFTEMLVVDGCFVLELLRGVVEGFSELGYEPNDPVFAIRGSMHSIRRDMIMLENQLPLFVLNRVLEIQLGTQSQTGLVAQLAVRFFEPLTPTAETLGDNSQARVITTDPSAADLGDLHCLDVFRQSLLIPKPAQELSGTRSKWDLRADKRLQRIVPTVTELRDAGFQFKKKETHRFWDIKYENGYIQIPSLYIHDGTKSLFLNLIAFEQCHIDSSNYITSYIIFMDNLIDSPEDISYLHDSGIIEHSLGSNSEVANMFNQLCQEVVFNTNDTYLSQKFAEVLKCYDRNCFRRWNAWKRTLKHKYFDNPWAYFSFFAAVILLFLTLFQSYFAAYAYFRPAS